MLLPAEAAAAAVSQRESVKCDTGMRLHAVTGTTDLAIWCCCNHLDLRWVAFLMLCGVSDSITPLGIALLMSCKIYLTLSKDTASSMSDSDQHVSCKLLQSTDYYLFHIQYYVLAVAAVSKSTECMQSSCHTVCVLLFYCAAVCCYCAPFSQPSQEA